MAETGLRSGLRSTLTAPKIVFIIVAAAPLASMVGNLPVAIAFGNGAGVPAAFLLITLVLLCFAVGYARVSRRVVNTGAFYTYLGLGLGRPAGIAGAFIAVLAYCTQTFGLVGAFGYFAALILEGFGLDLPWEVYGSGNQCTLRAAIQEANDNNNLTETDLIKFNIPDSVDPGVKTISPGSTLPFIEEPVIIDGYSQPGSSVNTLAKGTNAKLLVELNGNNTNDRALNIAASNSVVKGLVINRFSGQSIEIAPGVADLLTNVRVEGNFIGTNAAGTSALANLVGVDLFAVTNSTVGGTSRASRNLISGNELAGVFLDGSGCCGTDNNLVQGNLIGTKKDAVQALGNALEGVGVLGPAEGNRILSNSIFANGGVGIDLGDNGPTANDPGDTDTGSNRLQNFPLITSAKTISGTTTIEGTLNSRPGELYIIQFFSSPSGDEGQTFIGQKVVSTDASGNATFSFTPTTAVAVGRQITATTTRQATGDTSEFSAAKQVTAS